MSTAWYTNSEHTDCVVARSPSILKRASPWPCVETCQALTCFGPAKKVPPRPRPVPAHLRLSGTLTAASGSSAEEALDLKMAIWLWGSPPVILRTTGTVEIPPSAAWTNPQDSIESWKGCLLGGGGCGCCCCCWGQAPP